MVRSTMHWATTVMSTANPSSAASVPRRVGGAVPTVGARGSVEGPAINTPPVGNRGLRRSLVRLPAVHPRLGRRRRPSRRRGGRGRVVGRRRGGRRGRVRGRCGRVRGRCSRVRGRCARRGGGRGGGAGRRGADGEPLVAERVEDPLGVLLVVGGDPAADPAPGGGGEV